MTRSTTGRFIDLHVVQAVPFANLNRDDTNSVKTVQFGGVNRTRVSSQCWKRAIRLEIQHSLGESALRTRRVAERLAEHLHKQRGWPEKLAWRAGVYTVVASSVGAEPPQKNPEESGRDDVPWGTKAMVFIPESAIESLGQIAERHRAALETAPDKPGPKAPLLPTDEIDQVLRSTNGIINLLGRMLAELDHAKVDGAVQVAHVMTTHETDGEIDYFSAVDDVTADWRDSSGSAHMGHAEYSAGTFYRYTTLDLADLLRNLNNDQEAARKLADAFLTATILSLPQAKKNSTAPHTFPDLIAVSVRSDRPFSYAAAFEQPVAAGPDGGFTNPSINVLDEYAGALATLLGPRTAVHNGHAGIAAKDLEHLGERAESIDELIKAALDAALAPASATT
jgi:CRISPR system Cascade subunit CasC